MFRDGVSEKAGVKSTRGKQVGTLFWTFSRLAFLKGACVKVALSIAFKLFDFIRGILLKSQRL